MECPPGHVLQGIPVILTEIRPDDLGRLAPCASRGARAPRSYFDRMACWRAAGLDPKLAGWPTAFLGRVV